MYKTLWTNIVKFIHAVFVIFMLYGPFSNNKDHIILHAILVPFLYFHWLTNNDTCALTELEKFFSNKKNNKDTFIGSIISPIYIIDNCTMKKINKMTALLLWCFSLQKLT